MNDMKAIIAIISLCIFCGHGLAQTNNTSHINVYDTIPVSTNSVVKKPQKQLMIDGKVVKTAHLEKVQPDGLLVSYTTTNGSFGVKLFYFENFPESVQKQYGYDPKKAADFEADQKLGNAAVAQQMIEDDKTGKIIAAEREVQEAQIEEEYRQKMLQERAVEAQEDAAAAQQEAADAAMIQAMFPPPAPTVNVDVEQRTTIY